MTNFESVDAATLSRVLAQGNTKTRQRKSKKIDTTIRTYKVWFSLQHRFGECSNDNCTDPRPSRTGQEKDKAMIAEIEGSDMCRYCFLEGYGLGTN